MVEAVGPCRVFFGFDRAFFGAFEDWDSIPERNRGFVHLSAQSIPPAERVVRAHMSYATLREAYPTGRIMTVLREPVCRLLSHYVFWRGFAEEKHRDWGGWGEISALAREPIDVFLAEPRLACQIDNVATRLLLWPHKLIPADGLIDPAHDAELLAAARARLDGLAFADCSENPWFAGNLEAFLGVAPRFGRHNVSPPLPRALRLDFDTIWTRPVQAQVTRLTRLDAALWRNLAEARGQMGDIDRLRRQVIERGIARTANLLRGIG